MSGRLQGGVGSPILFSLTVFGPLVAIFVGHLLVGGFDPFTSLYLALAVIGMGGVCIAGSPDSRPVLSDRALWLAGLCFMIPTGIALVQAMTPGFDREYAFLAFIRFCGLSALVVMGGMIGQSSRRLFYFQLAFVGAMLVFGVFMLVTFELDSANLAPINAFQDRDRLSGTFLSPNSAGLVCALGAVICLAIILDRVQDAGRSDTPRLSKVLFWLAAVTLAMSVIDLGLSRSRSGLVLCMFAVFIQLSFLVRRLKNLLYVVPGVLIAVLIVWVTIAFRLARAGSDMALRMGIYQAHQPFVMDRPLLGHGFGSFVEINRTVVNERNFGSTYSIGTMHNVYLLWMEQAGVIALAGMTLATLALLYPIARQALYRGRSLQHWLVGVLAACLVVFGQGLLDVGLEHYSIVMTLAVVIGSGLGVCIRRRSAERTVTAR